MINTGLGTFEPSKQEIGSLYNNTRTGFWDAAGATFYNAWNYNPTSSVFRAVDQTQAYQSSNTYLNRDDLNKEYGSLGLTFKEDTREGVVNYLVERKKLELERSNTITRGPDSKLAKSFFFLESLATGFIDPINIGASFVPVVGQARFANMVARSGKNIARMKKGFREGLVGNAAVEPLVYGVAKSEQADYDIYDSFTNIAVGGFIGSAAHLGFGRMGDYIAEARGKPNIYQRLAAISPDNQQALLKHSVGRVLKGEKVDTGNVIVEKTRIGDDQLNKLDDQIKEFKSLYKNSLENGDRKSAKIYLQNIRNLQKTERDLFEAKRQANDDAKLQDQTGVNANNKKTLTEQEEIRIEKTKSEIANEAENMDLTNELRKKQLDIKDENLGEEFTADRAAIKTINNNVKNKTTIREAIEAGTNCTKRNS
jgi:acetolactate synthase small subunit